MVSGTHAEGGSDGLEFLLRTSREDISNLRRQATQLSSRLGYLLFVLKVDQRAGTNVAAAVTF
jgi:hypothetical protein